MPQTKLFPIVEAHMRSLSLVTKRHHSTDRLDVFINYTSNESGTNTLILDYSQRAATSCEIYCMDSAIS